MGCDHFAGQCDIGQVLAIGVGAILQVVWEVGKLVAKDTERLGQPLVNWVNLGGLVTGLALMYFTAFMVKF